MRIICYKSPTDYITHDFNKKDLLEILNVCKELKIEWYVGLRTSRLNMTMENVLVHKHLLIRAR